MSKKLDSNTVNIGDSLTIENISDIKTQFEKILEHQQEIKIKSSEIQAIDLNGIQMLVYMQRIAEMQNKKLSFFMKMNTNQQTLLKNNGFNPILDFFQK